MSRWALFAAALVLAAVPPAGAAEISRSYGYYTVYGDSPEELEDDLRTRGPTVANTGKRHPGATKVTFDTRLRYESRKSRCHVADVRVRVTAVITLPRWQRSARAAPETRMLWDTLAADIRRHEEQHADIAKRHAAALEEQLKALGSARDCRQLEERADRVKQRVFRDHDRDQTRFDLIEGRNFADRIERLMRYRMERRGRQGAAN